MRQPDGENRLLCSGTVLETVGLLFPHPAGGNSRYYKQPSILIYTV